MADFTEQNLEAARRLVVEFRMILDSIILAQNPIGLLPLPDEDFAAPTRAQRISRLTGLTTAPSAVPIPTSPSRSTAIASADAAVPMLSRAVETETRYQQRFYWVDETGFRVWPEPKPSEPVEFHTYDTVTGEWASGPTKAVALDKTGHDFGPGFGLDRCARCGTTIEQIEDNHGPLMCPQAERETPKFLPDVELDGSIAKRMREIARNEGRTIPDWPDDEKTPAT